MIFPGEQPTPTLLAVELASMRVPFPYLYGIRLPLTNNPCLANQQGFLFIQLAEYLRATSKDLFILDGDGDG